MKLFKKGQKGFTLVELMVVMAILAVLAAIVFPAVSGTSSAAGDAQVKQDAGLVNTAVGDYFGDQTGAAVLKSLTTTILGDNTTQLTNSRYPEDYLTVGYSDEFPASDPASNAAATAVLAITGLDGTTVITATDLASKYNAINLDKLITDKYIVAPASKESLAESKFHVYLWLVEKTTAFVKGGDPVDSRQVAVFKLDKAVQDETTKNYTLTYRRIY